LYLPDKEELRRIISSQLEINAEQDDFIRRNL
jgi:hypothetical protein